MPCIGLKKNMSLFVFLFSILLSVVTALRLSRFFGLSHLLISTMLTSVLFPEQSERMDYIGRHVHLDCLNASPPPCFSRLSNRQAISSHMVGLVSEFQNVSATCKPEGSAPLLSPDAYEMEM